MFIIIVLLLYLLIILAVDMGVRKAFNFFLNHRSQCFYNVEVKLKIHLNSELLKQ